VELPAAADVVDEDLAHGLESGVALGVKDTGCAVFLS